MTASASSAAARVPFRHSIRTVLFAATLVLLALAVAALAWQSVDAWSAYKEAGNVARLDAASNKFIAGVYEMVLERVAANNVLQSSDAASPSTIAEIAKHRKAGEESFVAGFTSLAQLDVPGVAKLMAAVKAATTKANRLRAEADKALPLPDAKRDQSVDIEYFPALTAQIDAATAVWFAVVHEIANADPLLAKLASAKELGWDMRLISGAERADIGAAIAIGGPIPPTKVELDIGYRAQVKVLWDGLERLVESSGTPPDVKSAVAAAQKKYFGGFVPLANRMRDASSAQAKYTMTAAEWTTTTTPEIGAFLDVMYAAARAGEARVARMQADAFRVLCVDLALLLAGLAVAGATLLIVRARVTAPAAALTAAVLKLADGATDVVLPAVRRPDEFGLMTRAVEVFKNGLADAARLRAEQEASKRLAEEEKRTAMVKLAEEFETSVKAVVGAVSSASSQLQSTAQTMSSTAEQTSHRSMAAAAAAEQASGNVQTVAAAAEELSASIGEIGHQVAESTRIASQAAEDASRTNAQVQALAEAAQKIGDVVKLINDIAGQTNLLALNATIEAARAGEAGKGFAVVASEVKSLATQTAKATDEIAGQVKAIQSATTDSVKAIETITGTIARINEIATAVAASIEEQGAATNEIARNVQKASAGTADVSTNIAAVTQAATETGTASTQVLEAARDLSTQSDALRTQVDGFVAKIRTA